MCKNRVKSYRKAVHAANKSLNHLDDSVEEVSLLELHGAGHAHGEKGSEQYGEELHFERGLLNRFDYWR